MAYTDDLHSLSHTKWNCKYHIVFAPKYRRKAFYEARRLEVGQMLTQLCEWKGIKIIEAEVCMDHVHMLVEIPPKMSVSGFVGYLKGKSSQMIFEKWANARFKYRSRSFWCRGYYVDTPTAAFQVPPNWCCQFVQGLLIHLAHPINVASLELHLYQHVYAPRNLRD